MRLIVVGGLLTLFLHYAWELAQAQLFVDHADSSVGEYAVHCFTAALGDVLIAAVAYIATALVLRRRQWVLERYWRSAAALWVAFGLLITVVFELIATETGRWTYASSMPTVFGVGASPLLQWVIVPVLTLVLLRALSARLQPTR